MVVVDPREYLRALELTGGEPPLDSLVGRVANGAAAVGVGPPLTQVTTEPSGSGQGIQALRAPRKRQKCYVFLFSSPSALNF